MIVARRPMMRRTCTVLKCLAGETPLCVLLLGCSVVKNNKGCSVFSKAVFQTQRVPYRVRLVPGLEGSQVWLEPARHPAAARIRCIKNICGHSELPQHEQRACRDWLLWLSSSPSFRKRVQSFDCKAFFLIMYTFMMHKRSVTLCSISPSWSPQFRLSKPQKLQNSSHRIHLDTFTMIWRYT